MLASTYRASVVVGVVVTVALHLMSPAAVGAAVTGTLLGSVTDAAGLAIPGATVTITEVNTNIKASAVSNENGNFVFSSLRNGVYRVESELSGFKKAIRDGIIVQVNTTVRVDLKFAARRARGNGHRSRRTPLLQTDRTDTGRIIESTLLQEVPLAFNRNFQGALITVPAATRPLRVHSEFFNSQRQLVN